MRPKSIRLFDGLFLAGILLGIVNFVLGMTVLPHSAGSGAADEGIAGVSLLGSNVFAAVIALTLWYLISRLRIAPLRWVLAILVLVGLANLPAMIGEDLTLSVILLLLASLLQLAALVFLFRSDARSWFAAREN